MQYIPKWLAQAIAGLTALLLLTLAVNQIYAIKQNSRAIDDKHIINISAEGKVTVKPDMATINVAVSTDGDTAASAQAANSAAMNKVISFIKSQGIAEKDIQTSGYNIHQRYDYSAKMSGKIPKIVGYTVYQNLTIKVRDLNKVSAVLDGAVKSGANQISDVQYTFADPDNYKEQAREAALKNARDKAERLAAAAGVHLGKLISFTETSNSGGPIPFASDRFSMGGAAALPQTEPGTQDITANISVSYEIY